MRVSRLIPWDATRLRVLMLTRWRTIDAAIFNKFDEFTIRENDMVEMDQQAVTA